MERSHHHHHRSERKRSRSPRNDGHREDVKAQRSRSPHRRRHHHSRRRDSPPKPVAVLPCHAQHLHKRDFEQYKALFADYLDLQKQLDLSTLSEDETKGRWKSFLGKWNRGELAEGWYDPGSKQRADDRAAEDDQMIALPLSRPATEAAPKPTPARVQSDEDEDEDDFGPALPKQSSKSGPRVPTLEDLDYRGELVDEDRAAQRADLRYERKQDRQLQKERLEELAPRADPGSRERQLEKKRETTAANRAFRDAKSPGAEEIGEADLLGDDADALKKEKREMQKKKSEREIRKEEVLRARQAEREERLAEYRAKEEKTMDMLRGLAAQRFGKR
ncbi:hypothetical protein MBLNU230_g3401t1 [Neophaeotheca triangularis]